MVQSAIFRTGSKFCLSLALASAFTLPNVNAAQAASAVDKMVAGSVAGQAKKGVKASSQQNYTPASATLKRGLRALKKRNMKSALASFNKLRKGTLERKVLAWAIAMDGRGVDGKTLTSISAGLDYWPGTKTIRRNIERAYVKSLSAKDLRVVFSATTPDSKEAIIALARAHKSAGHNKSARKTIAPLWRNSKLSRGQEAKILKHLGNVLTRSDHRARVEYLLSKKRLRAAERIAGRAGAKRLVQARVAVERKQKSAKSKLSSVPASQRSDPNYLFSKARYLRRGKNYKSAAKVLLSAKSSRIHANGADKFWTEQRILASDLLEQNAPRTAYRLASKNVAKSKTKQMDSEFFAGWIAFRKLNDPNTAVRHFSRLLKIAGTPLSISRGHYWLGRAKSKLGSKSAAAEHYSKAARYDTTYYGQLAAEKLGRNAIRVSKATASSGDRTRFNKYELVQAIKKLESAGQSRRARTIYRFLSRFMNDTGELALLAARAERKRDYQLSLQVGKSAFIRGKQVDNLAWPIGAIPRNTKTSGAGLPLAYAIARQESTFQVDARSSANALGLLQLLPTTAKRTAQSIGIGYSRRKLVTDAAYNARLGTAYLHKQMKRFNGSYILTFAAYNAGPRRAAEWIERYGDPRGKSLNFVVDWVEQIPFSETRNYVQRVMENYQVYKTRLKGQNLSIGRDLRKG